MESDFVVDFKIIFIMSCFFFFKKYNIYAEKCTSCKSVA